MKKFIAIIPVMMFTIFVGCSQTNNQKNTEQPKVDIKFETTTHDFGTITVNGNGAFDFTFTNTGKEPLVLKNVSPSCGCTVSEWPKDPIAPGAKGTIKLKYNTAIIGTFNKSATVYSNAATNPVTLHINGTVVQAPAKN